jgi:hypothetical protein
MDYNSSKMITLSYNDADGDKAISCVITNLHSLTVTQLCSCNANGICTVTLKGETNYSGYASYNFSVLANGQLSNVATGGVIISDAPPVNHPPVVNNINNIQIGYNSTKIITLTYSDSDSDLASSCR